MPACPDPERLRELESGALPDAQADALLAHVAECVLCREMLERFQRADLDSRILRRAVRGAEPATATGAPAAGASKSDWDIPDYECLHLCGEGAFGTVWAVRDRVGVFRALKVIDLARWQQSPDAQCRELTALEAYCRQVEPHPNLIRVYHVGVHGQKLYYTMDLADDDVTRRPIRDVLPPRYRAMTLRQVIQAHAVAADTAVEVVVRLLQGLARLHRVGLAHRDIKPANIVFVNRQPKLSDIGLITTVAGSPSHMGTPEYMPPDGRMDLTADTYALGRVLYEMLAGSTGAAFPQLPRFVHETQGVWDTHRLEGVIRRACSAHAGERFTTADRMREEIETCRHWSYEALFGDVAASRPHAAARPSALTQVTVAALNALPWVLGFILALVLIRKLV